MKKKFETVCGLLGILGFILFVGSAEFFADMAMKLIGG